MGFALCAMVLNVWIVTGRLEVPPLVIFGGAVAAAAVLGFRMYRSVTED